LISDFSKALKDVLFYLNEFDSVWKSSDMKNIFPQIAKDRIEKIEGMVASISKHNEIDRAFSDWATIGVWNVSDFLTFLLTSRLTIYLADRVEEEDIQGVKDADKYLLYFINYLMLTNIHPPSETHKDFEPFHPNGVSFPKTYEEAQSKMRLIIAEHFANKIFADSNLKREFEQILGHGIMSAQVLRDELRERFLKEVTPPLLIKNVGLAKELFTFHKLITKNIGFVIPTLLYQRIFKGLAKVFSEEKKLVAVTVPDFIVIRGGRAMGIEVGRERAFFRTRKAELVTTFSGACAIPTTQINVLIGNPLINQWYDFGFKCNRCYRSFILCKKFIEGEIRESPVFDEMEDEALTCVKICGEEVAKECSDAVAVAQIMNYASERLNKKLVHYRCLYGDEVPNVESIVPLFPKIEGMEALEEGLS